MADFELDYRGGAEVLKHMARAAIDELGRKVAEAAGDEAELYLDTTDRAVASVSVPAPQQAKRGNLTRAAAAAGLEVKST